MPHYDYYCSRCQHQVKDVFQKITDEVLKNCPDCQHPTLKRKPGGGIGLSFQGSGFYITDYKAHPQTPSSNTEKAPSCCPCGKSSSCS